MHLTLLILTKLSRFKLFELNASSYTISCSLITLSVDFCTMEEIKILIARTNNDLATANEFEFEVNSFTELACMVKYEQLV